MPMYDYRCMDCQHQYEKREGFDAPALQKCPTCGGTARRVIHAPPIVFKGSGFYVTDSRPAPSDGESAKPSETPAPSSEGEKPAKTEAPASAAADTPAAG
jgi:putative FmdB family regulatory protein